VRFAKLSLPLLLVAAILAGCGSVAAPAPNRSGDAAFVSKVQKLCSSAPALTPIDITAAPATISSVALADENAVWGVQAGIINLTPSLSHATPLAPAITDAAQMLTDAANRYKFIVYLISKDKADAVRGQPGTALRRLAQARRDLRAIGISSCLSPA
jgi:hypothetical protein